MIRRMMMAGLNNNGGGGTPVFVQSAKIMFIADGGFRSETGWNSIDQNTANAALVNQLEVSIPWTITVPPNDDWDIDGFPGNVGSGDFTVIALSKVVYCYNHGASKVITLNSLNATNIYKLRVASLYYADSSGDDRTDITVGAVTKRMELSAENTPYIVEFDNLTGSTSISFTMSGPGQYPMMSAIILEEYSTT